MDAAPMAKSNFTSDQDSTTDAGSTEKTTCLDNAKKVCNICKHVHDEGATITVENHCKAIYNMYEQVAKHALQEIAASKKELELVNEQADLYKEMAELLEQNEELKEELVRIRTYVINQEIRFFYN